MAPAGSSGSFCAIAAGIAYVRELPVGQRPEVFWASAPDAFEVLSSAKLLENIGRPVPTAYAGELAWSLVGTGAQVAEKCILFPPIEPPTAPTPA